MVNPLVFVPFKKKNPPQTSVRTVSESETANKRQKGGVELLWRLDLEEQNHSSIVRTSLIIQLKIPE